MKNSFNTKRLMMVAAALCAGTVLGDVTATPSDGGATLTLTGSGEYGVAIPATVTKIIKEGADKITLTQDLTTKNLCAGEIEVRAGTLGGKYYSSWGSPAKITVPNGATLDLAPTVSLAVGDAERVYNTTLNTKTEFVLAGTGVDGKGALVFSANTGYYGSAGSGVAYKLTLTANTTVSNCCDTSVKHMIDLAGFTLTKTGPQQFYCASATIKPGHIIVEDGNFIALFSPTFEGGEENTVTVKGGAMMLNQFSSTKTISWTLNLNAGKWLWYHSGSPSWSGPVNLLGDAYLRYETEGMKGKILGPVNANNHTFTINNGGKNRTRTEFGGATDLGYMSLETEGTCIVFTNAAERVIDKIAFNGDAQRVEFLDAGTVTFNTNSVNKVAGLVNDSSGNTEKNVPIEVKRTKTAAKAPPRLVFGGSTTLASYDAKGDKIGRIFVGCRQEGYGIVEVLPGAIITNDFFLGYDGGSVGAIYQRGGEVVYREPGASSRWSWYGYSYYSLAGGTFRTGASPISSYTSDGCTMIRQSGGEWLGSTVYKPFKGYFGVLMDGGTLAGSDITLSHDNVGGVGNTGMSECTFTGPQTVASVNGITVCGLATNDYTAVVNVNDGAKLKFNRCAFAWNDAAKALGRTVRCYLNLDGGVLMPRGEADFVSNTNSLARCTVYAGGVVIDTSEATLDTCYVKAALQKPEGRGIASIALPTDAAWLAETNHLGPMRVKIAGGNGAGASAFMDFDDTNRVVRGILVTSPGSGYQAGDTVTATVDGQFRTTTYSCAVTLTEADLVGGGVTKRGARPLKLTGVNSYSGPTRLEGGTLEFASAAAYPGGDVEFPAATLTALGANDPVLLKAADFAPAVGKKIRVTEADTLDMSAATWTKFKNVATFTGTVPADLAFEFVDSNGAPFPSCPWTFRLENGTLSFGVSRGTLVILL